MLADVYDAYRMDPAFDHLRTQGIVLVPGEGSSRPNVLIVGEAPGATENTLRRPFVGASGKVLRSLITDCAGLSPEDYFITNTVKYRPPGNRNPTPKEITDSRMHLRAEWSALGRPQVIIAVGGIAFSVFRPKDEGRSILAAAGKLIGLSRGRWLLPMAHPAYALRNPAYQSMAEGHWTEFGDWYRKEFSS